MSVEAVVLPVPSGFDTTAWVPTSDVLLWTRGTFGATAGEVQPPAALVSKKRLRVRHGPRTTRNTKSTPNNHQCPAAFSTQPTCDVTT